MHVMIISHSIFHHMPYCWSHVFHPLNCSPTASNPKRTWRSWTGSTSERPAGPASGRISMAYGMCSNMMDKDQDVFSVDLACF